MIRSLLLGFCLLGLAACSSQAELPPAAPLTTPAETLAQIPGFSAGPHKVRFGEATDWAVDTATLRVRIVEPEGDGPFPLIVFSHGFASDVDQYDAVFQHWASHGFIIVSPFHRDGGGTARAIFNSLRLGNMALIQARVEDVQLILNQLPALESLSPGISQRIDAKSIAIAGHSFGAFTAQQFAGARAVDPATSEASAAHDPRVKAVVAISPPGEMFGIINAESWKTMHLPMLATTGTWDVDGHFVKHWQQHKLSFDTAMPGNNHLLVVQGADHYLGNLICRTQKDTPPQWDALRMVNATSVHFLKNALSEAAPSAAANPLAEFNIDSLTKGFATLSSR